MSVTDASDYLAAVEEREHLESLVDRGREQFSGYGLELFERGLLLKIDKLKAEIARYEVNAGYLEALTAPFASLTVPCVYTARYVFQVNVLDGGRFVERSSVASLADWNVATTNIQMMCGCVRDHLHLSLQPTPIWKPPSALTSCQISSS